MDTNVDALVRSHRAELDRVLEPLAGPDRPWVFEDPGPDRSVLAEAFLSHIDLDTPEVNSVLREAYPYLDVVPGLKGEVHARVKAEAWMTLTHQRNLHRAVKTLRERPETARRLGFEAPPAYDTLREHQHERVTPGIRLRLRQALVQASRRLLGSLGDRQAQDAIPLVALRKDPQAAYNGYYGTHVFKAELRWDVEAEALLEAQFYGGTAYEGVWLTPLEDRLRRVGVQARTMVVDGHYADFVTVATQWRRGVHHVFRAQLGWTVDPEAAARDVDKRAQRHWNHPAFPVGASREGQARFLVDHGSRPDVEAVGRWVRDAAVSSRSPQEEALLTSFRSRNEGLNAEFQQLVVRPHRRGHRWWRLRFDQAAQTLLLVQLTRLQNGVKGGLCRSGNLV